MPSVLYITEGCHFDGHDAGYFTCLKVPYAMPFPTWSGETKVLKCEPLDSETLLESQQWMDRVFEPLDGKGRPFVLSKLHPDLQLWSQTNTYNHRHPPSEAPCSLRLSVLRGNLLILVVKAWRQQSKKDHQLYSMVRSEETTRTRLT